MAIRDLTKSELAELASALLSKAGAKHLTEQELAERWSLDVQSIRIRRRNGNGEVPPYLTLANSATNHTIRYRLADVEAWEESHLKHAATA